MNEMCVKIFNSEHYNTNDTKNIVLSEEAGGGEVERGGGINSIGGEVEVVLNVQSFVHIRVYLVYMNIREYSHNLTGIGGRRGGGVLYVNTYYTYTYHTCLHYYVNRGRKQHTEHRALSIHVI